MEDKVLLRKGAIINEVEKRGGPADILGKMRAKAGDGFGKGVEMANEDSLEFVAKEAVSPTTLSLAPLLCRRLRH